MQGRILVTGGAGYVGGFVTAALLEAGNAVVVLDDLSGAAEDAIERIRLAARRRPDFVQADIRDDAALGRIFAERPVDAVLHLAGRTEAPPDHPADGDPFALNAEGTRAILAAMARHGVSRLVHSSSAAIYGAPETLPIPEDAPRLAATPYAQSKIAAERAIETAAADGQPLAAISLRYFTTVGAHPAALLGEDPHRAAADHFGAVARAAAGLIERAAIHGDDFPTRDGTAIRDYLHVLDVAEGHIAALARLLAEDAPSGVQPINLGSSRGATALEALAAFRRVVGAEIPFRIVARRPDDPPELVVDPRLAHRLLGWRATRSLEAMCADHWAYQRRVLELRR